MFVYISRIIQDDGSVIRDYQKMLKWGIKSDYIEEIRMLFNIEKCNSLIIKYNGNKPNYMRNFFKTQNV